MRPLQRVTPDELGALQMENELLRYEVRHLRARLQEKRTVRIDASDADDEGAAPTAGQSGQAVEDLRWLLLKLDDLPMVGAALRRREGIQKLRDRYLEPGP
jgi:hypothetical protein